jgi:predicted RND superfamily exporter protein
MINDRYTISTMKSVLFSISLRFDAFGVLIQEDTNYAIFSVLFVICFIIYHTGSFFLGLFGMLLILCSFPITVTIYRYIGQVDYYSTLHAMVIFIVLGIAADDIFVVVDAWKQSALYSQLRGKDKMNTLVKRMSYALRRSAFSIAVTASTTAVAFLANINSEIQPIKTFGIYAAIIIPVNYFIFVFYFPAILMFWDQKIRNTKVGCVSDNGIKCCFGKSICKKVQEDDDVPEGTQ